MKYLDHIPASFLKMACLMLLSALTFSSCGNSSFSSSSLSPEQKEVVENSVLNGLVMVPLYFNVNEQYGAENDTVEGSKISEVSCISGNLSMDWRFPSHFGFKDSKGEWVKFDDEADYSEIATICRVIRSLWNNETWINKYNIDRLNNFLTDHGIDVNDKIKVGHDDFWNSVYEVPKDLAFSPEKVIKLNLDADKKFYELQNAAFLYFSENKDKISDRELFNEINKYFYNNHPDRWSWRLDNDHYGHKGYINEYVEDEKYVALTLGKEYMGFDNLGEARTENMTFCTYDGNEVPDDILVIGF